MISDIKIVFFDVGGVLLYKERQPIEIIAEHFGLSLPEAKAMQTEKDNDPVMRESWNSMRTIADQRAYASVSAKWFLERADLPVDDASISFISNSWNISTHKLRPGVKEIIKYLSPKYRLGIISNAMPSRRGDELTKYGLIEAFDPIVISRELGVQKPHPEIYEAALNLAGISAEHSAFVDDWPDALEGAKKAGFAKTFFVDFPAGTWDYEGSTRIDQLVDLKRYL